MQRGDIRWYEANSSCGKSRPVLLLTRDSALGFLDEVIVAPLTTTVRGIPSELVLGLEDGMPGPCAINFDRLQVVPKGGLGRLLTTLSHTRMAQADQAICFALGMDAYLE